MPDGVPENVTGWAVSSQNIDLYWDPPLLELQNGFIVGYRLKATETNTGYTFVISTPSTSHTFTSLHPYYTYSCTIAAMTVVGLGPFSAAIYITTFEDGKDMFISQINVRIPIISHLCST